MARHAESNWHSGAATASNGQPLIDADADEKADQARCQAAAAAAAGGGAVGRTAGAGVPRQGSSKDAGARRGRVQQVGRAAGWGQA